ncbi:MAG: hypothetical protein JJT89_05100 [Nitriliruptoraceae bacterium]|nr:hypothetical protein [Nitriliruptoraceae bacterium]
MTRPVRTAGLAERVTNDHDGTRMAAQYTARSSPSGVMLLGAMLALGVVLLLWQQVDASSCESTDLDLAACGPMLDAEQATADR